jgi:hypothetical protein
LRSHGSRSVRTVQTLGHWQYARILGTVLNSTSRTGFGRCREAFQPSPCAKRGWGAVGQYRATCHGVIGILASVACEPEALRAPAAALPRLCRRLSLRRAVAVRWVRRMFHSTATSAPCMHLLHAGAGGNSPKAIPESVMLTILQSPGPLTGLARPRTAARRDP